MKGGKFPDAPHMGVVYKQKDEKLYLAHYCGGEIENSDFELGTKEKMI